jgi:Holliday junction DNA helicase RuvA
MVEYIRGILIKKALSNVLIEVNGIGYSVNVSNFLINSLPEQKKEVKLFISETSSMYSGTNTWYGFLTEDEKELFETIKSVNKIGAKGALDILSRIGNKAPDFKICVINSDAQKLHEIFGFTLAKAEKLVLGLKNKIDSTSMNLENIHSAEKSTLILQTQGHENDAIEALKTLGYNGVVAKKVVTEILKNSKETDFSLEDIIKSALKKM